MSLMEMSKTEKSGIGMSKMETCTLWWDQILSPGCESVNLTMPWTHQCSKQIHPAQGFLRADLTLKHRGWHSIQTPPVSTVESTPCNKEGISGKQWQIHQAGCAKRL